MPFPGILENIPVPSLASRRKGDKVTDSKKALVYGLATVAICITFMWFIGRRKSKFW